jgi:hypothetical protein
MLRQERRVNFIIDREDRSSIFLLNIGKHMPFYTVSQPRRSRSELNRCDDNSKWRRGSLKLEVAHSGCLILPEMLECS